MLRRLPKELVASTGEAHKWSMTMVRATLGVLVGVLGVLAAPLAAQADEPLAGVIVILERADDKTAVAKNITGNDGSVRFYVPSGSYRIVAANATAALRQAAVRRGRMAPAGSEPADDRTASITVRVTGFGTVREQRLVVGGLSDGMEAVLFTTAVSSPITVLIRRTED
jgi:hypothetical protein